MRSERDTAAVVTKNGGKVLGAVKVPLNNQDFSSFLLQAQRRKPRSWGLANAGGDTTNSIKQAAEFGHRQGWPEPGRTARVPHRHPRAPASDRAGADRHDTFLLGPDTSRAAHSRRACALDKGIHPTMVTAGRVLVGICITSRQSRR
jgi:branched-chain amino acid transport system substrate-binding protein